MHFFETLRFGSVPWTGLPLVVWALILLALTFDFLNGLHDAANSVATVVSTRVLSPRTAIIWAAFFNFVAFLVFPLKVAGTIQGDVIDQAIINQQLIAASLFAACGWNLLTWYWGLPTSSSHALIGGMVGAAIAATRTTAHLRWDGLGWILVFIVLAPLIGFILGGSIALAVTWICRLAPPQRVDAVFRRGQLLSAAFFSLGHGGNDAQKTMGIIFALLLAFHNADPGAHWEDRFVLSDRAFAKLQEEPEPLPSAITTRLAALKDQPFSNREEFLSAVERSVPAAELRPYEAKLLKAADTAHVPTEVVLACHLAMGLGTMVGGWRIVKTMGQRIIRLRPVDGFCAETGAALVLGSTTFIKGIPISTTHTITGAIVGVGSLKRLSAVRWGVAGRVVWAWLLTIPGSALLAATCWMILQALGGGGATPP